MLLYLVRHAYAGQHGDPNYPDDTLRPLTKKGRRQFRRLVKKLARRGFAPTVLATSPLVRCRQTADVIARRLKLRRRIDELDALRPGSQLEPLLAWTEEQQADAVAWVGHSPDVEQLAASLLRAREGAILFAKGAIASIDFPDGLSAGHGELQWLATPKLFGG